MAPAAQKTLVGDLPWPASPQNSGAVPLDPHDAHPLHYESPFRTVDMSRPPPPSPPAAVSHFLSRLLALPGQYLSRHPSVSTAFSVACAVALLGLALFICGAAVHAGLRRRQRRRGGGDRLVGDGGGGKGARGWWPVRSSRSRVSSLVGEKEEEEEEEEEDCWEAEVEGKARAGRRAAGDETFEHAPGRLWI